MQMLVSAWDALSTQTMANCFRKPGISTESQETAIVEEVIAVQPPPSDAEIVAELLETEDVSDDDDHYSHEVADEPVKCPDKNELLQVIEILQRFYYF